MGFRRLKKELEGPDASQPLSTTPSQAPQASNTLAPTTTTTSTQSAVIGGNTPPTAPKPAGQTKSGGGFVNIGKYMEAAKPEQLASKLGGKIEGAVTKAKTTLEEEKAKTAGAIGQAGTAREAATGAAQKGIQEVTTFKPSPETTGVAEAEMAAKQGLSQEYKGPQELGGKEQLAAQAVKLEDIAKSTGTEAGRTGLIERYSKGKRTAGQSAFDAAMLTASKGALRDLASKSLAGKTFGAQVAKTGTEVAQQAQAEKQATEEARKGLQSQLVEGQKGFQEQLNAAVAAENARRAGTEGIADAAEAGSALIKLGLARLNSQGQYESTVPGVNIQALMRDRAAGLVTESAGRVDTTNLDPRALAQQQALLRLQGRETDAAKLVAKARQDENTYAYKEGQDIGQLATDYKNIAEQSGVYIPSKQLQSSYGSNDLDYLLTPTDNAGSIPEHVLTNMSAFTNSLRSGVNNANDIKTAEVMLGQQAANIKNDLLTKGFTIDTTVPGATRSTSVQVPPRTVPPGTPKIVANAMLRAWDAQYGDYLNKEYGARLMNPAIEKAKELAPMVNAYKQDQQIKQQTLGSLAKYVK